MIIITEILGSISSTIHITFWCTFDDTYLQIKVPTRFGRCRPLKLLPLLFLSMLTSFEVARKIVWRVENVFILNPGIILSCQSLDVSNIICVKAWLVKRLVGRYLKKVIAFSGNLYANQQAFKTGTSTISIFIS